MVNMHVLRRRFAGVIYSNDSFLTLTKSISNSYSSTFPLLLLPGESIANSPVDKVTPYVYVTLLWMITLLVFPLLDSS